MEKIITVPTLLIAFNRPDTTKTVFDKIRVARPSKLYVALDGPRENKDGEEELCKAVKEIVKNVDWPCEVAYKINEENKGAEVTVSSAISWVFEKEEYAVILEDDIIAPLSFFSFAQEMLERYKDDDRIAIVTGNNVTPIDLGTNDDYFFAKYGHSWGWATWRRVWKDFDLYTKIDDKHIKDSFLENITNSKAERKYYKKLFRYMQKRGVGNNTWDFMFLYINRVNNMIAVIPRVNLTSNIGIYGLHAKGKTKHHFRPFDEDFLVINHPDKVECNVEYDKHHFRSLIYNPRPLYKRIIRKLLRMLKINQ
ncbi:MAG: hypothetical protein K8R74_12690 [Bacteroidales bacterium]|nr:hypothetical protein [Bacteroidales bacterium]